MTHGGKRKGAGRKPAPRGTVKVPWTTRIDPELRKFLKGQENATGFLEGLLRRSKAFREWKGGRNV